MTGSARPWCLVRSVQTRLFAAASAKLTNPEGAKHDRPAERGAGQHADRGAERKRHQEAGYDNRQPSGAFFGWRSAADQRVNGRRDTRRGHPGSHSCGEQPGEIAASRGQEIGRSEGQQAPRHDPCPPDPVGNGAEQRRAQHVGGREYRDAQPRAARLNAVIGGDQRQQRRDDEQVAANDEHGQPANRQFAGLSGRGRELSLSGAHRRSPWIGSCRKYEVPINERLIRFSRRVCANPRLNLKFTSPA